MRQPSWCCGPGRFSAGKCEEHYCPSRMHLVILGRFCWFAEIVLSGRGSPGEWESFKSSPILDKSILWKVGKSHTHTHTDTQTCMQKYINYILTYVHTYIHTYQPTYLHTYKYNTMRCDAMRCNILWIMKRYTFIYAHGIFWTPNPRFKAHLFVTEDHAECLHWATAEGRRAEFRGFVVQGLRSSTLLWWHSHATWPYMGCLEREVCIWKSLLTMKKDAGSFCSKPLRRLIGHSWPVGKIDLSTFIYIYLRNRRSSPNWGVSPI